MEEYPDKTDRTALIRQQTSRIYMTTIAANEREDRLLTKKLDALDLEHRSQFLQMKKLIHYAKLSTERRFPQFNAAEAVNHQGKLRYRHSLAAISPLKRGSLKENTGCETCHDDSERGCRTRPASIPSRQSVDTISFITGIPRKISPEGLGTRNAATNQRNGDQLHNRIQYTENEVVRLRKSWAGQKSPPARKRTFLPHLENAPEVPAENQQSTNDKQRLKTMGMNRRQKGLPSMHLTFQKGLTMPVGMKRKTALTKNALLQQDRPVELSKSLPNL